MLGKLLKYEFKCTCRSFLAAYVIILLASLFVVQTPGRAFFANIIILIYVASLVALIFMMVYNILRNYNVTLFKQQGYLTNTLPVTTHQILISKLISASVWLLASIAVILASAFIIAVRGGMDIGVVLEELGNINFFDSDLLITLLMIMGGTIQSILLFYLVLSIVHTRYVPRYRVVIAIGIYLIIDWITSTIITTLFPHLAYMPVLYAFSSEFSNASVVGNLGTMNDAWLTIALTVIFSSIYYSVTYYILEHKMEVE